MKKIKHALQKYGFKETIQKVLIVISKKAEQIFEHSSLRIMRNLFSTKEDYLFFESEGDFCDNARALYEYMIEHDYNKKYKMVWKVSDSNKFKERFRKENVIFVSKKNFIEKFRLYYFLSISKYFFFTHPYWFKNWKNDQTVMNLWHGCGYKKSKGGAKLDDAFDYTLVTGKIYFDIHAELFRCNRNKILDLGLPRNDELFKDNSHIRRFFTDDNEEKLVLWMPTFRRSNNASISEDVSITETGLPIIETSRELEKLDQNLRKLNIKLIVKIHHLQLESDIINADLSNIIVISDEELMEHDILLYQLVSISDALITDYSSIAIDYLLLNKPIAFILDDFQEFNLSRGFVFDEPLKYMPGFHVNNVKEFNNFLLSIANNEDYFISKRKAILKEAHTYPDENNCERVISYLGL